MIECEKEYLKEQLVGFVDFIRWNELLFLIGSFIVFCGIFKWWGIVFAIIFNWLNHLQGGPMSDINNDYPDEIYQPNTCSAGIEGCKICDNEYSHEFNLDYESKRWYNK